MLILLSAVLAAGLLALSDERARLSGGAPPPDRQRSPGEAAAAVSIQVIWFDSETGRASYMIDATDGRLAAIGAAVSSATPVTAVADESFTQLLVFSFGANDTMEISYSPGKNLLMAGEVFYMPASDLKALLEQ